jgi:hypothetical protein
VPIRCWRSAQTSSHNAIEESIIPIQPYHASMHLQDNSLHVSGLRPHSARSARTGKVHTS